MDADANANANAGGSTIALRELHSGELMIENKSDYILLLDFMMIFVMVGPCWFPVLVIFPETIF